MDIAAFLEYGPFGLVAIAMVGMGWYMRSVEARATRREDAERERQKRYELREEKREARVAKREEAEQERQGKYITAITRNTATLATIASRMQAQGERMVEHDGRMQQEHKAIMSECFSKRGIGD